MGNVFGRMFRVATFGESHGPAVGCVVDGCPAGLPLQVSGVQEALDRRKPGQSGDLTSPRTETDRVEILSGVFNGLTLGTPIAMIIRNQDAKSASYDDLADVLRPSHADFTYLAKFGLRDYRGGGRASARETVGRVAAGAIAARLIAHWVGIKVIAYTEAVGTVRMGGILDELDSEKVYGNAVRCPEPAVAEKMEVLIHQMASEGDSIGGIVGCVATGVPAGLGEPVFDKLTAELAKAMLSIPASRGFEIGSGFSAAEMKGSQHNDQFVLKDGRIGTVTNRSGGVQGGIANGEPIVFRVAFKPTASIAKKQNSLTIDGKPAEVSVRGRHDTCVVPRAVSVVEAMACLVLADQLLIHHARMLKENGGGRSAKDVASDFLFRRWQP